MILNNLFKRNLFKQVLYLLQLLAQLLLEFFHLLKEKLKKGRLKRKLKRKLKRRHQRDAIVIKNLLANKNTRWLIKNAGKSLERKLMERNIKQMEKRLVKREWEKFIIQKKDNLIKFFRQGKQG